VKIKTRRKERKGGRRGRKEGRRGKDLPLFILVGLHTDVVLLIAKRNTALKQRRNSISGQLGAR
jgi:hypothetical protein